MVELFKYTFDEDVKYGITTVQPNRALKKCKTRNLRIEYFLSRTAVYLPTSKACLNCGKQDACTNDFVEQIIQKSL